MKIVPCTSNNYSKYSVLILLLLIFSCRGEVKNKFIGTYEIGKVVPLDSNSIPLAQQASDWVIQLKDSNNFHIYGNNKNVVGYWNVQKNETKEYSLLLQGGGVKTIARFNGNEIYFDKPDKLLDSIFSEALFIKKEPK